MDKYKNIFENYTTELISGKSQINIENSIFYKNYNTNPILDFTTIEETLNDFLKFGVADEYFQLFLKLNENNYNKDILPENLLLKIDSLNQNDINLNFVFSLMKKDTNKLITENKDTFVDDIIEPLCEEVANYLINTLKFSLLNQNIKEIIYSRKESSVVMYYIYMYSKSIIFMIEHMNFDYNEIFKIMYEDIIKNNILTEFELKENEIHEDFNLIKSYLMNFYGIDPNEEESTYKLLNSISNYHLTDEKKIMNASKDSIIHYYNINVLIHYFFYCITTYIEPKIINVFFNEELNFLSKSKPLYENNSKINHKLFFLTMLMCAKLCKNKIGGNIATGIILLENIMKSYE